MVRYNKAPRRVLVKIKVIYKPKASCIVLPPADRMNLAQFCALLMTIDKQLKTKNESDMYGEAQQNKSKIIRLRKFKNSVIGQKARKIAGLLFFVLIKQSYFFGHAVGFVYVITKS